MLRRTQDETMSDAFHLIFEATITNGKLRRARTIAQDLVADVEANEPETLQYQFYADRGSHRICFLDTYNSSEAFLEHLARPPVSKALDEILAICEDHEIIILGHVSSQARKVLATMGASILGEVAGFERKALEAAH